MSGSVRNALTAVLIVASTLLCRPRSIAGEQTNQSKFFLPQNPVAAAYVLGRLSNQELIDAPRGEFVDMALLQRRGLDRKYRIEALDGLATIRHSDRLTELLRAITELDKKGEESTGVMQELGPVLLQSNTPDLSSKRADLEKLALTAQLPYGRQLGWAGRIVAEPKVDTLWGEASSNPARLEDMLLAIGLLPEPGLREPFFARIKGLLDQQAASSLTDAAAQALVSIRGHEAEAFATLASLVRLDRQSPAVLDSLSRIPSTSWPTNDLSPLAETILERLKKVPPEQRAQPAFANALQFETELATRLPNKENRKLTGELRSLGPVLISLHAVYEQMRFDKTFLVIEESRPVVITLQNDDAMPHNLAILAPGALQEIGQAAEKMPPEPDAEGRLYVPVSPKVLHATKLVPPGQSLRLAFNAPREPGEYPYVCTFPGHWLRMSGTMTVVADVDAYFASHPASLQPKLTEWKLADFTPELQQSANERNAATGRELFTKLACVQCHKLGSQGYAYGPDLTDVFKRYHGNAADVLQQILEPSNRIDERYRNYNFDIANAESVLGMIVKEDDQNVTVQTGPADSLIQVIKKSEIQRRRPQSSSPMPVGLLNSLSKEEILDLLSFLEAGGNVSVHVHNHSRADVSRPPP